MKLKLATLLTATVAAFCLSPDRAQAQEFYIGEIIIGGWTFCPRGTAEADGQLIAITQNEALFSLYGTNFGGDGRTTFGLPDMRGRSPVHVGQGPGLANRQLGQKGGTQSVTLTQNQMPSHTHTVTSTATTTVSVGPGQAGAFDAGDHIVAGTDIYASTGSPNQALDPATVGVTVASTANPTGGSQSFQIMNPYLAVRYCVVLFGIYPSRN